jgi:DNA polymerase-3 subunit delta'
MIDLPSRTATWPSLPSWQTAIAASALAHRQRWPHALLISGRRGLGKRLLALHFARALLCEAPLESGEACGVCPGCGYVGQGTHPDLQLIEPVTYDDEGNPTPVDTINVERVRELIEFTQLSPHRQRAKVGLIAPAEAMNAAAANALLKTLEEPPAGTFLLLVSHQPARLPPTILSRCLRLPAPEPDRAAAAAWLAQNSVVNADPELVLAQAGGAPLFALSLADADIQRERDHLLLQLAQPERLSPLAFGARLDGAPKDERKLSSPTRCTGCWPGPRTSHRWRPARRLPSTLITATLCRGSPGGWHWCPCSAIIECSCDSARCFRIRCNRDGSPRRC